MYLHLHESGDVWKPGQTPKELLAAGAALPFLAALLKDTQHTHSGLQQPGFHFDLGSEGRRDPLSGNNAILREK